MVLRKGLVFSWLHKLRNTQGNIYGTYLGNIYGIYKECITNISIDIHDITINIHKYIHHISIRHTGAAFGGAPMGWPLSAAAPLGLCV